MTWTSRQRWIAYGIAGLVTILAVRWVDGLQESDLVTVAAPAAPRAVSNASAVPLGDEEIRLDWLRRQPPTEVQADPFASGAPQAASQIQPAPLPPAPRPQAPALPFAYVGKWTERGQIIVFLAHGEQTVAVRGTGPLDANYAVESVDERKMVLTYLPLGIRQTLTLDEPSAASARRADKPHAAPEDTTEDSHQETN